MEIEEDTLLLEIDETDVQGMDLAEPLSPVTRRGHGTRTVLFSPSMVSETSLCPRSGKVSVPPSRGMINKIPKRRNSVERRSRIRPS